MKVDGTNLDISIKSYLGKIGDGVLVLFSVKYNEDLYESTYWYTEELDVITFDEDLKGILGEFEKMDKEDINNIISFLKKNTSDYNEVIDQLKEFESEG
jgi:hypothetical protein